MMTYSVTKKYGTVVLLSSLIAASLAVRLYKLNMSSLWIDELYNVSTASSILETAQPLLPSGYTYLRALPFTLSVAASFRLFGVHEWSARLPSAIFGVLTVPAAFFIMRRWFDTATAFIASFLIAFAPLGVCWSREVRMYSMFQFLYLLFAFVFYEAFEKNCHREERPSGAMKRSINRVILMVLAGLLFCFSFSVHALTIFFIPTFLCYCAILALVTGSPRFPSSKCSAAVIAAGLIVLAFLTWNPGVIEKIYRHAAFVPFWSLAERHAFYYKWMLEDTYPLFVLLYPVSIFLVCRKDIKKGAYLFCLFAVPFFIHSFIFQWKSDRYLLYAVTFFLLGVSYAIKTVLFSIFRFISLRIIQVERSLVRMVSIVVCSLSLISGTVYAGTPWLGETLHVISRRFHPEWRETMRMVTGKMHADDIVISTNPAELKFYGLKNKVYKLRNWSLYEDARPCRDGGCKYLSRLSNAPYVVDFYDLARVLSERGGSDVWFLFDRDVFESSSAVPPDIHKFLLEHVEWLAPDGRRATDSSDKGNDKILVGHLNPDRDFDFQLKRFQENFNGGSAHGYDAYRLRSVNGVMVQYD